MMTRREFAGALACGLAAAELPQPTIVVGPPGSRVPASFAAESCVFTRGYAACPEPALMRRSLVTGQFPHAGSGTPRLNATLAAAPAGSGAVVFVSEPRDDSWSETSCHIALAIRHPRSPAHKVFDFPVSTVDIAPTLLSLAGIELPEDIHGRDLSAIVMSGQSEHPESIYAEGKLRAPGEWRMVVRGFDKIVVTKDLAVLHLFNLGEDAAEEHDLALEPGHQLKVDELTAIVRAWMKRTGDGVDPSGLKKR